MEGAAPSRGSIQLFWKQRQTKFLKDKKKKKEVSK